MNKKKGQAQMKKVIGKNGQKVTFFNNYTIGEANSCPECGRTFKDYDLKNLEERKTMGR